MSIRYLFSLLLINSIIVQAPSKGMPDLRAIEAKKRLQERLKQKTDASTKEGKATMARVKLSQEENARASQEFVEKMMQIAPKKNDTAMRNLPKAAIDAVSDFDITKNICTLLNGKPVSNKRKLKSIIKQATENATHQ